MSVIQVESSNHFNSVLSGSTYVVADFYADWCGPCKMIAPVYEQLAKSETKPGKLAFTKVNVDTQQALAKMYGVSAMPTFLVLKNGKVTDTIRGADASTLRAAVHRAATDAVKAPAKDKPAFQSKGYTLGGSDTKSRSAGGAVWTSPLNLNSTSSFVRFIALYVVSFFAFDSYAAAATSSFAAAATSSFAARR